MGEGLSAGQVANERPRNQLDHRRQGRPFMAPECQHGAIERVLRRCGWLTFRRNAPPQRNRFSCSAVQFDFSARDSAGSEIKNKGVLVFPGPAKGNRIRAEDRTTAASRSNP
ncbi:hypothetical protein D9M69_614480 [compost metagenome]